MASLVTRSYRACRTVNQLLFVVESRCSQCLVKNLSPTWKPSYVLLARQSTFSHWTYNRSLHSTNVLMKKMKEELYEKCRVYSPAGEYLCTTELFIVEKFCHRFHRFSYGVKLDQVTDGDASLKAVQLTDKHKDVIDTDKRTKTMKFSKDISSGPKMPKILEILVDTGKVNIHFERKGSKAEPEVKEILSQFADLKTVKPTETGSVVLATLKGIDNSLLLSLLDLLQKEYTEHISSVREMLDVVKQGK